MRRRLAWDDKVKQMNHNIRVAHAAQRSKRTLEPCRLLRCAACAARTISAALALSLLISLSFSQGQEDEKVPQLRRVLLSPQRLEEELKHVKEGVLLRMPLAEFDALVESARRASVRKPPPRLME